VHFHRQNKITFNQNIETKACSKQLSQDVLKRFLYRQIKMASKMEMA